MNPRRLVAPGWLTMRRVRKALSAETRSGGFRILLFHDVPEPLWPALDALIDNIKKTHGVIDPWEAARRISSSHLDDGPAPCLLSFDDGFVSNYELAEHVLARHDVKAIFFICPGLMNLPIDAQRRAIVANIYAEAIHQEDLIAGARLMDWDEAAKLRDLGHEIGAHSMTHPSLATLDEERLAAEIHDAGRCIRDQLGAAPSWFAFPFGDIDSVNAKVLATIGRKYAFCRSGVRGLNRPGTHRLGVLADQIDFSTGAAWRALIVDGAFDTRYRHARARLAAMAEEAEAAASP